MTISLTEFTVPEATGVVGVPVFGVAVVVTDAVEVFEVFAEAVDEPPLLVVAGVDVELVAVVEVRAGVVVAAVRVFAVVLRLLTLTVLPAAVEVPAALAVVFDACAVLADVDAD